MIDLERIALALFKLNHPEADPETLSGFWEKDAELRRFWINQVSFVIAQWLEETP